MPRELYGSRSSLPKVSHISYLFYIGESHCIRDGCSYCTCSFLCQRKDCHHNRSWFWYVTLSIAKFNLLTNVTGINLSFAKLLLSKNCNVVIADLALRPEAEDVVNERSAKDIKPRAVFVKTDVTNWDQLTNMFEVAEKEFGGADIVSRYESDYRSMLTMRKICPGAGVFE